MKYCSLRFYPLIPLNSAETPSDYQKIKENFESLNRSRIEARDRDYEKKPDDEILEDLSMAMSRGNAGVDGISTRHDVIGQFLFEGIDLQEKPFLDPERNYTHEEKLILYHTANGCCQIEHSGILCGRSVSFDDSVVDHILPYSKGGKTELVNGRIAYKSCNIARGNRDTFNHSIDCKLL